MLQDFSKVYSVVPVKLTVYKYLLIYYEPRMHFSRVPPRRCSSLFECFELSLMLQYIILSDISCPPSPPSLCLLFGCLPTIAFNQSVNQSSRLSRRRVGHCSLRCYTLLLWLLIINIIFIFQDKKDQRGYTIALPLPCSLPAIHVQHRARCVDSHHVYIPSLYLLSNQTFTNQNKT